jgi:hypothetical protein
MVPCNRRMSTAAELSALVQSDDAVKHEEAIDHLLSLLTSPNEVDRRRGHELRGSRRCDCRSCLNYGFLASGFTDPLVDIVPSALTEYECRRSTYPGLHRSRLPLCPQAEPTLALPLVHGNVAQTVLWDWWPAEECGACWCRSWGVGVRL